MNIDVIDLLSKRKLYFAQCPMRSASRKRSNTRACMQPQTTLANGEVAPDLKLLRDRSELLLRKEQFSDGTSPENSLAPQPDR
nr:hypothetical protein [Rhizobium album]